MIGGVQLSNLLIAGSAMNRLGRSLAALVLALRHHIVAQAGFSAAFSQVADGVMVRARAQASCVYYLVIGRMPFGTRTGG